MSTQIESMRSGLIAVKSLLSRDPCAHANTAIQMIDAMLAQLDHPEQMARLGWQYVECPACGLEGARAFPKPEQEPVAREHITDGNPCWCEPETNYIDPETGISVIVHKEPQ